jgi:hypothetical protein
MANKKRGYYTIKLGGKNRVMHFSMNFWSNFTEIMDVPLEKIANIFDQGVSIKMIRTLIYSALLANDQEQANEIDYNEFTVGMWLEDFNPDELDAIVKAMMESRILGSDLNAGLSRNVKKTTKKGK